MAKATIDQIKERLGWILNCREPEHTAIEGWTADGGYHFVGFGELAALRDDHNRLVDVVKRLPVSADGVPLIPMWSCPWQARHAPGHPHVRQCHRWKKFYDAPGGVWHVSGDNFGEQWFPVSRAYSTREAALAHLEATYEPVEEAGEEQQ